MRTRVGTFKEFQDHTLAVVKGEHTPLPSEPKIWSELAEPSARRSAAKNQVRFKSLEAGVKLLSTKNRALLRLIATRRPQSVSELAALSGRAQQNVLRTLNKLSAAGLVRLDRGAGRARRPVVAVRKVRFEIDLLR
jgi:predicted transcriptional regulator